jgi:hypothetical protein
VTARKKKRDKKKAMSKLKLNTRKLKVEPSIEVPTQVIVRIDDDMRAERDSEFRFDEGRMSADGDPEGAGNPNEDTSPDDPAESQYDDHAGRL